MSRRTGGSLTGRRHVRKLFWRLCRRQMRKAELSFQSVMLNFHSPYVIRYLIGSDNISKQKCKMWSFRYYVALNHADVKFTMKSNSKRDTRKQMKEVSCDLLYIRYTICNYIYVILYMRVLNLLHLLLRSSRLWSFLQQYIFSYTFEYILLWKFNLAAAN